MFLKKRPPDDRGPGAPAGTRGPAQSTPRRRGGFILRRLAQVAIFLAFLFGIGCTLFVLLEIALRALESENEARQRAELRRVQMGCPDPSGFFYFDADLGWTCTPGAVLRHSNRGWEGTFTIGQDGMRRFPHLEEQAGSVAPGRRVMLLGDSCAFCMGARDEESIDHFLIAQAPGIMVKNISSPGWSPDQYYMAYQKFKDSFRPTDVFMLICHLNDFFSLSNCTAHNRFKPTVRLAHGRAEGVISPVRLARVRPPGESFFWDSRVAFRIGLALEPCYLRRLCGVEEPYGMVGDYERRRLEVYSAALDEAGKFQHLWTRFEYLLRNLQDDARQRGARFTVVFLPLGEFPELLARIHRLGKLSPDAQVPTDCSVATVAHRVQEICSRHGVGFLHPEAGYRRWGEDVFSAEGHYGPVGNKLVAAAIGSELAAARPAPQEW